MTLTAAGRPRQAVPGGRAQLVEPRAMVRADSFSYTRHSNMRVTQGPRSGSGTSRARVAPIDAFIGLGCGVRSSA